MMKLVSKRNGVGMTNDTGTIMVLENGTRLAIHTHAPPRIHPDIGPSQKQPTRKRIGIEGLRFPRPDRWGVLVVLLYGKSA